VRKLYKSGSVGYQLVIEQLDVIRKLIIRPQFDLSKEQRKDLSEQYFEFKRYYLNNMLKVKKTKRMEKVIKEHNKEIQ